MVGWHHRLNGHEFEWALGVGDGQGGLACCSLCSHRESDTIEWLDWTEWNWSIQFSGIKYIHNVQQLLPSSISRTFFIFLSWNSVLIKKQLFILLSLNPWQSPFYFLTLNFTALGPSSKWNYAVLILLWLAFLTQYNVLKVHPCYRMCQNFLPF